MKLFYALYRLTAWVCPIKRYRLRYKDFCQSLDIRKDLNIVQENYQKVLEKLVNKKNKIKVVFLIRENQKWVYQSIYEEFEKSDKFEPLVLVSILTLAASGKDKTRKRLEENYNFFKSRGINVECAYKDGKYIDLKVFNPDIVFYDQSWDLPKKHEPYYVSTFALTCYCPYSYEVIGFPEDYTSTFHRFLYRFFARDEISIKRYSSYNKDNVKNCVAVGYPKFDEYYKDKKECDIWKYQEKIKVIYAPHHSLDKNGLNLATFNKNGKFILELAKKYPETTWVFKPHPRLKYALLRTRSMTENEINNYFNEWAEIGTIYEEGDYINLFRTSDLMITDGCSFWAEYLPTEKPLICPINKHCVKSLEERITQGFYFASDNSELENLFVDLLINKNDPKLNIRKNAIDYILSSNKQNNKNIYNEILKIIERTV